MRIVKLSGDEELLQFNNAAYEDFELRQGDEVAFYYVNHELQLVHNFTIGEVFKISRRSCYLATYVYGSASEEVTLLRQFRDEVLLPNATLAILVQLYYWISPKLIRMFGNAKAANVFVAAVISPAVWLIRKWANTTESQTGPNTQKAFRVKRQHFPGPGTVRFF